MLNELQEMKIIKPDVWGIYLLKFLKWYLFLNWNLFDNIVHLNSKWLAYFEMYNLILPKKKHLSYYIVLHLLQRLNN